MLRIAVLGLIALSVLAIDVLVKAGVEFWLAPFQQIAIIGNVVRLTRVYNSGVAFGMLPIDSTYLIMLTGVLIAGLAVWAVVTVHKAAPGYRIPLALGLLLGGAAANFGDRMLDGRVTDYLDMGLGVWRWPTFNLADTAIMLGVFLFVMLIAGQSQRLSTDP